MSWEVGLVVLGMCVAAWLGWLLHAFRMRTRESALLAREYERGREAKLAARWGSLIHDAGDGIYSSGADAYFAGVTSGDSLGVSHTWNPDTKRWEPKAP